MSIIYAAAKCKKPKRKPGWQKAEAEHKAWLKSIQTMTSGIPKTSVNGVKVNQTLEVPIQPRAARYVPGVGGKVVPRPELLYRDNPEMLNRELEARARRFNVAPAYNKGNDQFVTEEELVNQLKGNKRRP
jgi:hypothetical protein